MGHTLRPSEKALFFLTESSLFLPERGETLAEPCVVFVAGLLQSCETWRSSLTLFRKAFGENQLRKKQRIPLRVASAKKISYNTRMSFFKQTSVTLILLLGVSLLTAGRAPFTERDTTDFDTVIRALEGSGTWKVDDKLGAFFTPTIAEKDPSWRPMRSGRWIYTDWGWMLSAKDQGAWATYHYGVWTNKGLSPRWSWQPGADWQVHTVDWRGTEQYIGWRPVKLDRMGEFLIKGEGRNTDPTEWSFIPVEKFGTDLSPSDFLSEADTAKVLKTAAPLFHVIKLWREIERPGPDPEAIYERLKVKFVTQEIKTLPTVATPPPYDLPTEYFLYRPKFHQDEDGMARRVSIYLTQKSEVGEKTEAQRQAEITDLRAKLQEQSKKDEEKARKQR